VFDTYAAGTQPRNIRVKPPERWRSRSNSNRLGTNSVQFYFAFDRLVSYCIVMSKQLDLVASMDQEGHLGHMQKNDSAVKLVKTKYYTIANATTIVPSHAYLLYYVLPFFSHG